jgi:TatD DNase family protein
MPVDSHCHLADDAFQDDLAEVVARAQAAGIARALCILSADEPDEVARAEAVAGAWPAVSFAAAIHPHRSGPYGGRADEAARVTEAAVRAAGAVAVGEIGLDYHYDFSPPAVQRDVFAAQASLAVALGLPVVIHTREATDDTLAVLRETGAGARGVMHCFTGTVDEARRALDLGMFISIAGIVTFAKAESLREVARFVPPDRLLVETDAPFLAPVPHRGTRNEPAFVVRTLAAVAAARGLDVDAAGALVRRNFDAFVDTPRKPMV